MIARDALTGRVRRVTIAAAVAIAIAIAIAVLAAGGGTSSGAKQPTTETAVTVQRRDLVATDTEGGTIGYASPATVYNRLSGTLTALPTAGQLINQGQTLYKVDNQPIILLDGSTPAFRNLTPGIGRGPDIRQLNRDLVNMGFDANHEIAVNDSWQTGTTDAVDRWQSSLDLAQTGTISLGHVVFLPGRQRVAAVTAQLGAPAAGAPPGSAGVPSAQPVMQTTSTHLVVTVNLDATKKSEAVLSEPVTVQLPDGTTSIGTIAQISPSAQSPNQGGSSPTSNGSGTPPTATTPVTITLPGHRRLQGLDQAAVSVNFQQQKAPNALSVPVTALLARPGGGYAVQRAAPPHALIPVTLGLFASGYVQISGPGVRAGLQVTDSQG